MRVYNGGDGGGESKDAIFAGKMRMAGGYAGGSSSILLRLTDFVERNKTMEQYR